MQEDIEHRSVTLIVNGAKFSGRMLKSAIRAYMGYRKENTVSIRRKSKPRETWCHMGK